MKILKTKTKSQINPYNMTKGQDAFIMPVNESMHYDGRIDRQIKVPIDDVDVFLLKLKGAKEPTLTLRKKR